MAISIGGIGKATTIGKQNLGAGPIQLAKPASGSGGSGSGSGGQNEADILSGLISEMYERFAPQEIVYNARSEDEIRSSVSAWLRPSYEQAITTRKEQDADEQGESGRGRNCSRHGSQYLRDRREEPPAERGDARHRDHGIGLRCDAGEICVRGRRNGE